MTSSKVPSGWEKWCRTGKHGRGARKKMALLKSLVSGTVRGYLSDLPLRPDLDPSDSMYPSVEHLVDPTNHQETVVEPRIINDMKSHLTETEFWQVIEHLFVVGVRKGRIKPPFGKRLPRNWKPTKHFSKAAVPITVAIDSAKVIPAASP